MTSSSDNTHPAWDATQYRRYGSERLRPALDLINAIRATQFSSIVDLGCGTGEITRLLADKWSAETVVGVDRTPNMLARAKSDASRIEWIQADLKTWQPGSSVDLIFANASLHWISNHERLIPQLLSSVNAGGTLAIQMPRNWDAPSHVLLREQLRALFGTKPSPVEAELLRKFDAMEVPEAAWYANLFGQLGVANEIWETTYFHRLEASVDGRNAVLEWLMGTTLRPVLSVLDETAQENYFGALSSALAAVYPTATDGTTLYPFKRLFILANA